MKKTLLTLAVALTCATSHAAQPKPAPPAFACPYNKAIASAKVDYEVVMRVHTELVRRFDDALGKEPDGFGDPKVAARVAVRRVDDNKMAALADVSGCAALYDVDSSCAQFFDPELGDPLSVFMSMKKSAPLRRQFEDAIAHLARPDYKRAAQACIKLVGVK